MQTRVYYNPHADSRTLTGVVVNAAWQTDRQADILHATCSQLHATQTVIKQTTCIISSTTVAISTTMHSTYIPHCLVLSADYTACMLSASWKLKRTKYSQQPTKSRLQCWSVEICLRHSTRLTIRYSFSACSVWCDRNAPILTHWPDAVS